jgi:hypothetical protein
MQKGWYTNYIHLNMTFTLSFVDIGRTKYINSTQIMCSMVV